MKFKEGKLEKKTVCRDFRHTTPLLQIGVNTRK